MSPEDRDAAWLLDILEAGSKVERYVRGRTFSDYRRNDLLRDAVERNAMIIGEAARNLSQAFTKAHPEVPWSSIIALRNILAHRYGAVDDAEMWKVATVHVPDLIQKLQPLVPPPPESGN